TSKKSTQVGSSSSWQSLFINTLCFFRLGQLVGGSRPPDIKSGQQKNAHQQVGDQSADNHDGKRPLRIRSDVVRESSRQKPQGGHQHGHHNRPEPADGSL